MIPDPFIQKLADYVVSQSSRFTTGSGDHNLKLGEIEAGHDGVFLVADLGDAPDEYTPVENEAVSFWCVNTDEYTAHQDALTIYYMLHQGQNYPIDSYYIYFSRAQSKPQDLGRNRENKKMFKVTILFISRSLIS